MPITAEHCKQLWYRAVEAEIGIAIELAPDTMHSTKNQLYSVRKALADPRLDEFVVFEPEPKDGVHELFIVRKTAKLPDA